MEGTYYSIIQYFEVLNKAVDDDNGWGWFREIQETSNTLAYSVFLAVGVVNTFLLSVE